MTKDSRIDSRKNAKNSQGIGIAILLELELTQPYSPSFLPSFLSSVFIPRSAEGDIFLEKATNRTINLNTHPVNPGSKYSIRTNMIFFLPPELPAFYHSLQLQETHKLINLYL